MEEESELESQTLRNGQQMMKTTLNNISYQMPNYHLDDESIQITPKEASYRCLYLRQHSEKVLEVESLCVSNVKNQNLGNNEEIQILSPINDQDMNFVQNDQQNIMKIEKQESQIQTPNQLSYNNSQKMINGKSVINHINLNSNSKLEEVETFNHQGQSQQFEKTQKIGDSSLEAQSQIQTPQKSQPKKQKSTHNLINSLQLAKRFIAKLKQVNSKVLFKNLSFRQFSMINDAAANYKFYVEKKDIQQIFDSIWRFVWDILMIFFVLYLLIMIPLSHVFGDNDNLFTAIHQHLIKQILVLEFLINLNSEIYSNGVTIKDRYTIFKLTHWKVMQKNQVTNQFYIYFFYLKRIDLLLFCLYIYSIYHRELHAYVKYLDFLLFLKYREIPSKLSELEIKFQISDSFKNWLKLLKLESIVLILAHVACCIFLLIGQFEKNDQAQNWIDKYNFSNYSIAELYLTSFYFIIISICTVGYGDISPCTITERSFIILVALISTNITAYSFSQISEIVKFEDIKKESFNKVMVGINFQMKLNSLGINLQQKVRKYFEYLHDSDLQKSHIQESLLDRLPNHLKEEVLLEMNKQFINSIQIFKGFSPQCIKMISLSIKQKQLLPDEIAIQEKEFNDSLYFVSQGTLQILCSVSQKKDEIIFEKGITLLKVNIHFKIKKKRIQNSIKNKKKQDSFGYEGFLYGENCPYSIKSVGQSVISYLEKDQFLQVIKLFPIDYVRVYFKFNLIHCFQNQEKFCYTRDKQKYDSFQKVVYRLKCISCQEYDHYPNRCQFINPTIKYKNDKSVNLRNYYQRIKVRNTNTLKNNKYYQDIAVTFAFMKDDTLTAQQDTVNFNEQSYSSEDQSFIKFSSFYKNNNVQEGKNRTKDMLHVDFVKENEVEVVSKNLNDLNTKTQQAKTQNINIQDDSENKQKNEQDVDSKQIQELSSSISFTQSIKSLALSDFSENNKIKSKEDDSIIKQQEQDKLTQNSHKANQDFQVLQANNQNQNMEDNFSMKQSNANILGQQNTLRFENIKQKQGKKQNFQFAKSYFSKQLSNTVETQIQENENLNNEADSNFDNKAISSRQKSLNINERKTDENQNFRKKSNSEVQIDILGPTKMPKPQQIKNLKVKIGDKVKIQANPSISSISSNSPLVNKRTHHLFKINSDNKMKFSSNQVRDLEDNQLDSNQFQIRFMLNLQNLDLLVIRKEFLLMQQKNKISDFIQVPDNEIDIDILHNYKYYYINGNLKQILQRIKIKDEKNKDVKTPNMKRVINKRKIQRKTHRYKPTSFNTKKLV